VILFEYFVPQLGGVGQGIIITAGIIIIRVKDNSAGLKGKTIVISGYKL
jgi:hypothetical protein